MPAAFWNRRCNGGGGGGAATDHHQHGDENVGASRTAPAAATLATATNLRWRARIAKEAMAFPFDDSSTVAHHDDDDSNSKLFNQHKKSHSSAAATPFSRCRDAASLICCRQNRYSLWRWIKPIVVPACAAGAVGSSLYALTVSTHVMVAFASALTVATSVVVLIQQRMLHSGGSVQRHHVSQQTQALRSLQVEKERLYRRVLQLDETAERRRDVHRQLQACLLRMTNEAEEEATSQSAKNAASSGQNARVTDDDIASAVRIAALYRQTKTQLLEQSQHELVVLISNAMVESLTEDGDSAAAAESTLLSSLESLQGVTSDENLVRQFLKEARANADPAEGASSPAVAAYLNLLRQALMDGELAAMNSAASVGSDGHFIPGTPQRRKRRARAQQLQQQQRKQLSALFVFDPDKRLQQSRFGEEAALSS